MPNNGYANLLIYNKYANLLIYNEYSNLIIYIKYVNLLIYNRYSNLLIPSMSTCYSTMMPILFANLQWLCLKLWPDVDGKNLQFAGMSDKKKTQNKLNAH